MSPAHVPGNPTGGKGALVSDQVLEKSRADTETVLRELESRLDGLSKAEADSRLKQYGLNAIAREKRQSALMRLSLLKTWSGPNSYANLDVSLLKIPKAARTLEFFAWPP